MINGQSATLKLSLPQPGEQKVYQVFTQSKIDLSQLNLASLKVDLLGTDIIISNPADGASIVLAGMALYLFSPTEAPTLLGANGTPFNAQELISKIGKVWQFSAQDFISITSLDKKDPNHTNKTQPAEQPEPQAATQLPPTQQTQLAQVQPLQENPQKYIQEYDSPPPEYINPYTQPPKVTITTPKIPFNDATSTADNTNNGLTFTFEALLLQPGVTISSIDATTDRVDGGGAFETAVFDARNSAQFSQEIIDVSAGNKTNYVIYSDNPAQFTSTTATRIISITPYLPDNFTPSSVKISGLPGGFSITGATLSGGIWTLTSPTLASDGSLSLPIVYPTTANTTFTISTEFIATFNASPGSSTPATGTISYVTERDVEVRTVTDASNGNYLNIDNELVWALATNVNSTKILGGDKTITVYGGESVDDVTSGNGNDTIYGGNGADIISTGGGNDLLQGGAGADTLVGGSGIDTADFSDKTTSVVIDMANLVGGSFIATVNGVTEDTLTTIENLTGGSNNDTLSGDATANVLDGGAGNDTLMGRGGNDTLIGNTGLDTASYAYATNGITVALSGGAATVAVTGSDVDTLTGIENLTATDHADTLTGDANANILLAGLGNDTLNFSVGNDTLDGEGGTDTLVLTPAAAGVTLNLGTLVGGYASLTDGTNTQQIAGIENLTGSTFADTLTGDAGANTIIGAAGNDVLDGAAGNDVIYGGTGADTLTGGANSDTLRFDDLATGVTVTLSGLGAGTANDGTSTDTFTTFETLYLTNQADTITTSTAADVIFTLDGNDTINMVAADSANDSIDGGTGTDTIDYTNATNGITLSLQTGTSSGNGTDTLTGIENVIGSGQNDTISGSSSVANSLDGGAGTNTLSYAYTATAVTLNLASVNGSGFATATIGADIDLVKNFTTIIGGDGADVFTASNATVTFTGGLGNDTFNSSLTGNNTFNGDGGGDLVSYATHSNALNATLDVSGNATITINGKTDTLTGIESLTGGGGNDTITGNASDNTLNGGNGNDTINGGDGLDSITGGAGNDILNGGIGNDTFFEGAGDDTIDGGSGTNTISYASQSSIITFRFDTGTATGASIGSDTFTNVTSVIGGSAGDTYHGSSGNDTITDSGGANTVFGSLGNDALSVAGTIDYSSLGSRIVARLDLDNVQKDNDNNGSIDNTDTVTSAHVIGGALNDTFYGDSQSNDLTGNNGNDSFFASTGTDRIFGGSGADTYSSTSISGTIAADLRFNAVTKSAGGTDTLSSIENITSSSNNDSFTLIGSNLASFNSIDAGTGTDSIILAAGTLSVEAAAFDSVFNNIETLDLRSATLAGADTFAITTNDILGLTSTRSLSALATTGFNFNITANGGYSISSNTTVGNTQTVVFTQAGQSNVNLSILYS